MSLKNIQLTLKCVLFLAFLTPSHLHAVTLPTTPPTVIAQAQQEVNNEKTIKDWATISLVTGLLSIVMSISLFYLSLLLAILSLIFGIKVLKKVKNTPINPKVKRMAVVGLIMSGIWLVAFLLILLFGILFGYSG